MYIIIIGAGQVGGDLARRLAENRHDIVVIDQNKAVCDKIYAETGVVAIHGNASDTNILKEAGVGKADMLVAVTRDDASNLVCAILAKSLGVPQIIVRMRNPAYEKAYQIAGVTFIIRLSDLVVNQMIMEIEKPKVRRLMTLGGGKADIYSVVIPAGAEVAGKNVESIARGSHFPPHCVFIALYNKETDEFSIPRGKQVIKENDELIFISPSENVKELSSFLTD